MMAKATVSRRVFRKCPGQVRATLRPNPLAMVSKKARGTCNLANKDGVSLSGYYSWAAPSRCFAGGVAGEGARWGCCDGADNGRVRGRCTRSRSQVDSGVLFGKQQEGWWNGRLQGRKFRKS